MPQIYLDNAATSWPKPESVYSAVDLTQRSIGVSASRGSHASSVSANQIVKQARQTVAKLIGADADEIAFANSGTDSLSMAILGTLKSGDHAITTTADHNSVIRPLVHLRDSGTITLTIVPCDRSGFVSADLINDALTPKTKLVAITHASNVLGTLQPVEKIGQLCRAHGALFLLDAAQTIGHLPINVDAIVCDMLSAPGHKGLLGPLGTGMLYVSPTASKGLTPLRFGGTGSQHVDEQQPKTMPKMLEAGSLNVPAIAGLLAGVEFVTSEEGQQRTNDCEILAVKLTEALNAIEGVRHHGVGQKMQDGRIPVVAFSIEGYDSETVGAILDSSFQIQSRAGFHCAPLLHQTIGTAEEGLIRLSVGLFNTPEDIDTVVSAISEIAQS